MPLFLGHGRVWTWGRRLSGRPMPRPPMSIIAVLLLAPLGILILLLGPWWAAHQLTGDRIAATTRSLAPRARPVATAASIPTSPRTLYLVYCAQCHGESGDGQGTRQLDRPARSFLDGGFSFGNTLEALYRTISNGIGGTPMPGYAQTISPADRRKLAEYVRSLGPDTIEVNASDTIMVVSDTPRIVRGHLPSLAEGYPEHPRGILLGSIDGLTFEYAADDVRLLAVRQGDFVERTDWTGRGGSTLKPLGQVIDLVDDGHGTPLLDLGPGTTMRLQGTTALDDHALVRFQAGAPGTDGTIDASEWGEAITLPVGSGYRRYLELRRVGACPDPRLRLPSSHLPLVNLVQHVDAGGMRQTWFIRQRGDGQFLLQGVAGPISINDIEGRDIVVTLPENGEATLALTTLIRPTWDDTVHAALQGGAQ